MSTTPDNGAPPASGRPPERLLTPLARKSPSDDRSKAEEVALGQRDRLYDLLSEGQAEQARLLGTLGDKLDAMGTTVGTKLDAVNDSVGGLKSEIASLKVTPKLITLLGIAMIAGLIALGVLLRRPVQVDVDAQGIHASTGMSADADPDGSAAAHVENP